MIRAAPAARFCIQSGLCGGEIVESFKNLKRVFYIPKRSGDLDALDDVAASVKASLALDNNSYP